MQRTPGNSKEERKAYWVGIIQESRSYPAGIAAYCRDKGVQQNNYYHWFHRLRAEHPEWDEGRSESAILRAVSSTIEKDERPTRRRFTAAYKRKILKEIAASSKGQVAALLRREGLYASQMRKWKEEAETSYRLNNSVGSSKNGSYSSRIAEG